jgi:probable F420-dependent oxidoreductase
VSVGVEVSLGLWQDRAPEEVIETAAIADALKYPAVWIGEMATWDSFALGTHVGRTFEHSSLVLGPFAVAVRDPAMIAMGAASVATATGCRVAVALGTSSTTVVEGWHGRDRSRSGIALAESAQAVRALLDGEKADVAGTVVRTRGYRLRLPAPRSELIIAAFGGMAIKAAAQYADRMVLNLVDPPSVAALVADLRAAAEEAGRPCPRVAVWTTCAIDPGSLAIEQLRRGVVGYLAAPGYAEMFARAGYADLVAYAKTRPHPAELLAKVPAELNTVVGLVGDADHVRARIDEYVAAGADDVVIVPSATDEDPAGEHTMRAVAEIRDSLN